MGESIIRVADLCKSYGPVQALRGVTFDVHEGEVFGLLGPNGAGKTTTVEILEGLRTPDRGTAEVCSLNPESAGEGLKEVIGAVLQSTSLPAKLRVREALELFAMTASLGATESLVMPPQMLGSRDLNEEQQRLSGIGPGTVRLSLGLEDGDDLLADIEQALAKAAA